MERFDPLGFTGTAPPCAKSLPLSFVLLLALSACTGGGGGGLAINDEPVDPVVLDIPIAYVKRALPEDIEDYNNDLRDPLAFNPGARLLVRPRASNLAAEIDVTDQLLQIVAAELAVPMDELAIDIKDLDTSFNGSRLIFAARVVPEPADANLELTSWNLWTYDFATNTAAYLIPSRGKRNEGIEIGGGQDIAPHYLTDDRIVFSSTRQTAAQARQLNEGRGQIYAALTESGNGPATVLHIYDPVSSDFEQLSFNQSHDLDPTTLDSGEILFSRWNNTPGNNHISLYRINPSGRQLSLVYGHHSADSGTEGSSVQFIQARAMGDGRLLALIRPFDSTTLGGNLVLIDAENFVEQDQAIWANQGAGGSGQSSLTSTEIRTDGELSSGGQYSAAYPLRDGTNRILVSWSQCRVENEQGLFVACSIGAAEAEPAPPLYGLWIYDPAEGTQQIVVLPEEGFMLSDIVAGEPRAFPAVVDETEIADSALAAEGKGLIQIDSVYDFDGEDNSAFGIAAHAEPGTIAYTQRQARFVRLVQPVPLPDNDLLEIPNYAFGVGGRAMREILGYTAVEPDGSVTLKAPANTPFQLQLLDAKGRRIGPRHNFWLQVGAGEILRCTGCHTANSELPHGRLDSQPLSSNPGARTLGSGAIGFPATDPTLFGTEPGQTMAQIYQLRRPDGNETAFVRDLDLQLTYSDEWTAAGLTPDPSLDYSYDPAWTDIPPARAIIVDNLDPQLEGRIVINYVDHIQPIWERVRTAVDDGNGTMIDRCTGCHTNNSNAQVPAGQLDLTAEPSDLEANHFRSYRELLSADDEQWLNTGNAVADRQRECTVVDENNNVLTQIQTFAVQPSMSAAGANASGGFFGCFETGPAACGRFQQNLSAPPANCIEDGGTVQIDSAIDHRGMLSDAELRLISEWLDVGAQYYNNPFDTRLAP